MNCLDCTNAGDCHNERLNDHQLIEAIRISMDKGAIEQAKEELEHYARRLRNRDTMRTGR